MNLKIIVSGLALCCLALLYVEFKGKLLGNILIPFLAES